ncbi:hypothetical protein HDR67_02695 [bacterium]|nr:hypothetical protein [bacterium]
MNKKALKILIITIYSICICMISVFSTIMIQKNVSSEYTSGDVSPFKLNAEYLEENFDTFIAFGDGLRDMISIDLLLKSNLINDQDKKVLSEYNEACKGTNNRYYNIYLGVKDGKDVVELHHMSKPNRIFKFSSNLNYKFELIIQEIEVLSDKKLNKEFLQDSNTDSITGKETMGIIIDFKSLENGLYSVYFKCTLNDRVYIIDK